MPEFDIHFTVTCRVEEDSEDDAKALEDEIANVIGDLHLDNPDWEIELAVMPGSFMVSKV